MDSLAFPIAVSPGLDESQENQLSHPIILLVEDHEDSLLLLSCILEPLNCKIITASDGLMALSLAQAEVPDLILLDILLPCIDGVEVITQLRQSPKTCDIPIIALTALARGEDQERILQAGANAYLRKPYLLGKLETIIQSFLPALKKASPV